MATPTTSLQGEVLLRHIDRYLGPTASAWRRDVDGSALPVQVLLFSHHPFRDAACLVTFGLSAHHLMTPRGTITRTELVVCTQDTFDPRSISALLLGVATDAIQRHAFPGVHGVLAGDGPVLSNPAFEHLYLTYPGYLPESFEVCTDLSPPVTFLQLLPLSSSERAFLTERGWKALEQRFDDEEIDLLKFDQREQVA